MSGNKSAILGIIGIILGAGGLGYGILTTLNLQTQISIGNLQSNYGAKAYLSVAYGESGVGSFVLQVDAESYDPGNNFDLTIHKYIVPITGTYLITGEITFVSVTTGVYYRSYIYRNSTVLAEKFLYAAGGSGLSLSVTTMAELSAGDQVYLAGYKNDAAERYLAAGEKCNYIAITFLY